MSLLGSSIVLLPGRDFLCLCISVSSRVFPVIQGEAKDLGNINVDVLVDTSEILPPFGRLDDNERGLQIQKKLRVTLCTLW